VVDDLIRFRGAILNFVDEWWILSNFAEFRISVGGRSYRSVEHYYQAMKALNDEDHERIRAMPTPAEAKRLGKTVPRIPDWPEKRIDYMRRGLSCKFSVSNTPGRALLATGQALLVEGNDWGDDEWGICKGEGTNILGVLLMERRGALRAIIDELG
jgi:ribA/ribD-fused uncharacterized protein